MRKNIIKLLSILLVFLILLCSAACSKNNTNNISSDNSNSTAIQDTENSENPEETVDTENTENTDNSETAETTDDVENTESTTDTKPTEQSNTSQTTNTEKPSTEASKPTENNNQNNNTSKPSAESSKPSTETTKPSVVKTTSISLNITSKEIYVGDTFMLSATVYPSNASDKNVTWSTTNNKIATVSLGKVTGQNVGTAKITVTNSGGQTDTCIVTVKEKATVTPSQPTTPPVDTAPPDTNTSDIVTADALRQIEEGFIKLVNEERKAKGLSALSIDSALDNAAQTRSDEAMTNWSHTRPDGTPFYTAIDKNKYPYVIVGENLGMTSHVGNGSVSSNNMYTGTTQQIKDVYTWMFTILKNSPSHYANMINGDYTNTGIGISYKLYSGVPMFYLSQIFGSLK